MIFLSGGGSTVLARFLTLVALLEGRGGGGPDGGGVEGGAPMGTGGGPASLCSFSFSLSLSFLCAGLRRTDLEKSGGGIPGMSDNLAQNWH